MTFDQADLMLTATILRQKKWQSKYDFEALSKLVDFMNFANEYVGKDFEEALVNRGLPKAQQYVNDIINSGVSPNKIVMGLPFSGISFEKSLMFGIPTFYRDTCIQPNIIRSSGAHNLSIFSDEKAGIKIVMDSSRSLANKVRFAMKQGLAGVAVHDNIGYDDVLGECETEDDTFKDFIPIEGVNLKFPKRNQSTFPLLRTINAAIKVTLDEISQEVAMIAAATEPTTTETTKMTTASTTTVTTSAMTTTKTKTTTTTQQSQGSTSDLITTSTENPPQDSNTGGANHFTIDAKYKILIFFSALLSLFIHI